MMVQNNTAVTELTVQWRPLHKHDYLVGILGHCYQSSESCSHLSSKLPAGRKLACVKDVLRSTNRQMLLHCTFIPMHMAAMLPCSPMCQ